MACTLHNVKDRFCPSFLPMFPPPHHRVWPQLMTPTISAPARWFVALSQKILTRTWTSRLRWSRGLRTSARKAHPLLWSTMPMRFWPRRSSLCRYCLVWWVGPKGLGWSDHKFRGRLGQFHRNRIEEEIYAHQFWGWFRSFIFVCVLCIKIDH